MRAFSNFLKTLMLVAFLAVPMVSAAAEPIKIGLMGPLVGPWASEGQEMKQVVSLLVDEVNAGGGIKGRPVELLIEDDAGDPRTSALAAQKLVSSGVIAVIGTYGSAVAEASQNIIDEAGVLHIANGATSVRLTEKGLPLFFRTSPRDDAQGRVAAKVIVDSGAKRVAILHDNSSYSKGLADESRAVLKKDGVDIVFFDALTPGERDYSAILTKLKSKNPDLLFYTGYYPEVGTLLRQRTEMNWDLPMLGGDAANNKDLIQIAGKKAAEGYSFVSPPTPNDFKTDAAKSFLAKYEKKYGAMPNSMWAVLAGDAFLVIAEALKQGTPAESEAVAMYLKKKLKDYPALTGAISFNEKGDRVGDLYFLYAVDAQGNFVMQ